MGDVTINIAHCIRKVGEEEQGEKDESETESESSILCIGRNEIHNKKSQGGGGACGRQHKGITITEVWRYAWV